MKYDSIDQIRGWAIFLVLCNHVAAWVDGLSAGVLGASKLGQLGVQLFFVASAYTLCLSWFGAKPQPHGVARFYFRRFFRIAPLYYVGILLFAGLHHVSGGGHGVDSAAYPWQAAIVNALFLHGFVPFANNNVVPGGWSIGTEMAFYLLFPGLVFLLQNRQGALDKKRIVVAWAVVVVSNVSLQFLLIYPEGKLENNSFWYFNLINQLAVFLSGMALFVLDQTWGKASRRQGLLLSSVGVSFGLALLWVWKGGSSLAFAWVPTLAGISMAAFMGLWMRWSPSLPWLTRLGQHSYGIYVVHTLFAWHGMKALRDAGLLGAGGDGLYVMALTGCLVLSFVLASVLARWVEVPGQAWGRRCADACLGGRARARVAS